MVDQSFTLQAIMQMQKDLGALGQKIDGMRDDLAELKNDGKDTRTKLSGVENSIASFKGAMKVLGGLFALALVVVGALATWALREPTKSTAPAAPPTNEGAQKN